MKLILRITFQNVFKKDLEIGTDKFLEDFQALAAIAYFTQDNGFKFDPTRENYNIESKNGDFICSQMLTDVMYEFNAVRPDEEIAVLKPQYQVFSLLLPSLPQGQK